MAESVSLLRRHNLGIDTSTPRWPGLILVLALHLLALWGLMAHRLLPVPHEAVTLLVNFIAPPATLQQAPKTAQKLPEPKSIPKQQARQLVAEPTVHSLAEPVATLVPPAQPTLTAPAMHLPLAPVALGGELSVACPERRAPIYPPLSRRHGESGKVVLRVTLDEFGTVAHATIDLSSGFSRLDEAALSAVRAWRCVPAQRNGRAVQANAVQPFNFVLEGN